MFDGDIGRSIVKLAGAPKAKVAGIHMEILLRMAWEDLVRPLDTSAQIDTRGGVQEADRVLIRIKARRGVSGREVVVPRGDAYRRIVAVSRNHETVPSAAGAGVCPGHQLIKG